MNSPEVFDISDEVVISFIDADDGGGHLILNRSHIDSDQGSYIGESLKKNGVVLKFANALQVDSLLAAVRRAKYCMGTA